jgi:hypothetical protein
MQRLDPYVFIKIYRLALLTLQLLLLLFHFLAYFISMISLKIPYLVPSLLFSSQSLVLS